MAHPHKSLRGIIRHLAAPRLRARGSTPVNKAPAPSGDTPAQRLLPQLDNPVVLGAAAVGALGAGLAITRLRSSGRGGRPQRFATWVSDALGEAGFTPDPTPTTGGRPGGGKTAAEHSHASGARPSPRGASRHAVVRGVKVDVLEGFGKLPLVSVDVRVDVDSPLWSPVVGERVIDVIARAAWHNPEIAPVAVRVRLLSAEDDSYVADMSGVGYDTETAHPEELVARFGAPQSDPTWRG